MVVVALANQEPVNDSGFVPGIGLGYAVISISGLGLIVASAVEQGLHVRVALVVGAMAWIATRVYLGIWGLQPGALRTVPMGTVVA